MSTYPLFSLQLTCYIKLKHQKYRLFSTNTQQKAMHFLKISCQNKLQLQLYHLADSHLRTGLDDLQSLQWLTKTGP